MELEEVKSIMHQIHDIYQKAYESSQVNRYISRPPTEKEGKYLHNNGFFKLVKISTFKLAIIEIYKLVGNDSDDEFSLKKVNNKFNKSNVEKLKSDKLLTIKFKELNSLKAEVEKIRILRHRHYAHTDSNRYDPDLYYTEMDKVFKTVYSIIQQMFLVYMNTTILESNVYFDPNRFNEIKILADVRERRISEKLNKFIGKKKEN
jgi:hypothetical protein